MIQLTTAAKLENAINKARTVKPLVRVARFGHYTAREQSDGRDIHRRMREARRQTIRFMHLQSG